MSNNYVCDECGNKMFPADDTVLVCETCGHSVDIDDYGHEHDYDDYYDGVKEDGLNDVPDGCRACGGPYPHCKTSCKLFDD